jgi:3'-phosphoadenosine 5'-phosphosulfate sulfotransferase (PAPS reductase)/FAD synthetase
MAKMTNAEFYIEDLKSKFTKIDFSKYFLSYSGGKDSHLLFWFIKTYLPGSGIPIVSVNTRMEFTEISDRMYKNADIVLIPELKPHEVIEKYGSPCFSKYQDKIIKQYQAGKITKSLSDIIIPNGHASHLSKKTYELLIAGNLPKISDDCCLHLKKKPLIKYAKNSGRHPIMGVSGYESSKRKENYKSCFTKTGKFTPLWDLSKELEDEIYREFNIELPKIYNYVDRTGCAGCPYGIYKNDTEKELSIVSPTKKRYLIRLFGDAYRIRGVNTHQPLQCNIFEFINPSWIDPDPAIAGK